MNGDNLPASRLGDLWLLDELTHLRRLLDDCRANYRIGMHAEADEDYLEILDLVRGIEIEFYGTKRDEPPKEGGAQVVDLAERCSRSLKANGPAEPGGAS